MEIHRTIFFFALVLVATTASTPHDGTTNIISKIQHITNGGSQNRFARDADTPQMAVMSGEESISEGSDLVLKCTFYTSQPPQMILWNVNSNIVRKSEGRIDIETSGSTSTLTVSSMTPQDAGDYNCFDMNLPPNEDTITVEVFAEIVSADEMGMMEMVMSGSETLQGPPMGLILLICTLVVAATI